MEGMGGMSGHPAGSPVVIALLALFMLGYLVWTADRLAVVDRWRGSVRSVGVARRRGSPGRFGTGRSSLPRTAAGFGLRDRHVRHHGLHALHIALMAGPTQAASARSLNEPAPPSFDSSRESHEPAPERHDPVPESHDASSQPPGPAISSPSWRPAWASVDEVPHGQLVL